MVTNLWILRTTHPGGRVTYLVERGDCHILEKEGDNRVEEGDDGPREDPDAGTHDAKLELETGDVGGDDLR